MISFKSFSQNDTEILLSNRVARLVAKDLVTFDGLLIEHDITKQTILTLDNKVLTLEDVINNLRLQLENRNSIIQQKDAQIKVYDTMSKDLEKALKKERRTKKLYKIGSAIGLAFVLNNIISK